VKNCKEGKEDKEKVFLTRKGTEKIKDQGGYILECRGAVEW